MARVSSINITLADRELRWVRQGVKSGQYNSASDVVREGLRKLFKEPATKPNNRRARSLKAALAEGYKATAARDRKMAAEWSQLADAWPEE